MTTAQIWTAVVALLGGGGAWVFLGKIVDALGKNRRLKITAPEDMKDSTVDRAQRALEVMEGSLEAAERRAESGERRAEAAEQRAEAAELRAHQAERRVRELEEHIDQLEEDLRSLTRRAADATEQVRVLSDRLPPNTQ